MKKQYIIDKQLSGLKHSAVVDFHVLLIQYISPTLISFRIYHQIKLHTSFAAFFF